MRHLRQPDRLPVRENLTPNRDVIPSTRRQLQLDRQLVSESWVTESTSNQLTAEQGGNGDQYGYFWWLINEPESPGYLAAGAWYQRIFVIPSRRLVIVVTADRSDYAESVLPADFDPVLAETVIEPLLQ